MHIVQRSQPDLDLFRIRGRLDGPGAHQLEFIMRALPVNRAVLFDLRRLANATDPDLPQLLKRLVDLAPSGKRIQFAGLPGANTNTLSREGTPAAAFI